jgi:hypothetical protein
VLQLSPAVVSQVSVPQARFFPMAIARFKDLCLDAGDPARLGAFWAAALGRTWQAQDNGDGLLTGPTSGHTIWVNRVPEGNRPGYTP